MSLKTRLEFDVDMTCNSCAQSVREGLLEFGKSVSNIEVNVQEKSVCLDTDLPQVVIQEAIEKTGRRAILKGYGTSGPKALEAAVVELRKPPILGVIRLLQANQDTCIIDGTVDGLEPGDHGMHIYQFGDLSKGCEGLGEHYNPRKTEHGGPGDNDRHHGDLGNITADSTGRAQFRREDNMLKVWDVIGRCLAITANADDLGKAENPQSKIDGNSGKKLTCAVVARSAGLFENPKRICQCSGATVWEERDMHK